MQSKGKYHGTYPIRRIGKSEQGIHMPTTLSGDWGIYEREDGIVELVPMGKKVGAP